MNIRGIANAAIQVVNPNVTIQWAVSTGSAINAAGKRTPTYAADVAISAQLQAVASSKLQHVQNLNMQGVYKNVRMYGDKQGIVRPAAKGGDLLRFANAPGDPVRTWLVVVVLETWPDWCSVIACMQSDA